MNALDIVMPYQEAWTSGDFETAAPYLADDFVMRGPIADYGSKHAFVEGFSAFFAQAMRPGWHKVAAYGDEHGAMLLYDLFLASGGTMRIADHLTVKDGKIQAEEIVWDTHAYRAARAAS